MVEVPSPSPTQSHDSYNLCLLHGELRFDMRQNKTVIKYILKPLKFNLDQLSCFLSRGQNTLYGYEGYFEQILAKIAPLVHFTIDQYLLAGTILWKVGANRPEPPVYFEPCFSASSVAGKPARFDAKTFSTVSFVGPLKVVFEYVTPSLPPPHESPHHWRE